MKLLLTSAGLSNKSIVKALEKLVGKSLKGVKLAFVPTAANVEPGSKSWMIEDFNNCQNVGLEVDIVDISAVDQKIWLSRLEEAEVLLFGGGNTFHLMHWMKESGLEKELLKLLEKRVYMGISAGSCMAGPSVFNSVQNLFGEQYDLKVEDGLHLVNFQFIPHLNSPHFANIRKENLEQAAKDLVEPVYALDDESAIVIDGDQFEVVSEGEWYSLNER